MQKRAFIWTFVGMAMVFVPVVFLFGLATVTAPAILGVAVLANAAIHLDGGLMMLMLTFLFVYACAFWVLGQVCWWVTAKTANLRYRRFLHLIILTCLFGCSFLRCISSQDLGGSSGTYNLWTAVARFVEVL